MAQLISDMQYRLKATTASIALIAFKIMSGAALGLTFALIVDEVLKSGTLAFTLVIVTTTAAFFRVAKGWSWTGTLIFNLICVLVGLLVRMYILVAPGA